MTDYVLDGTQYGTQFTFESPVVEEAVIHMMGEEYKLPTIKHKQNTPMTSLYAAVIKLHNRVQALEAELKGEQKNA